MTELQAVEIIDQLTTLNTTVSGIYTNSLFCIGVLGAVGVLVLLYKFIRLFY